VATGGGRRERRSASLVVICAAHFLIGLDGLAVAIALPALQRDLGLAPLHGNGC
jgi:hypothetical protein